MERRNVSGRRSGCLISGLIGALFVATIYIFHYELSELWSLVAWAYSLLLRQETNISLTTEEVLRMGGFAIFFLLGVFSFTFLIVFMSSHYVLPVTNTHERMKIVEHLYRFMLGGRPPVLVVKGGKQVNDTKPHAAIRGGVALVDLDSAIVLERPWMIAALESNRNNRFPGSHYQISGRHPAVRIAGPGLTFINKGEKLRGIVDLRKQFRIMLDVLGYTSDGIEVKTNVFSIFTLGQPAEVIQVAYQDGARTQDLRVLHIDSQTRVINKISDELDESDKREIHHFAQTYLSQFEPNAPLGIDELPNEVPPYQLDQNRITAAVYSQTHGNTMMTNGDWTGLPVQIASDVFRDMVSKEIYSSLYLTRDLEKFPLRELSVEFSRKLRYAGVISFQFVHRLDDRSPLEGQKIDHRYFRISTPQEVKSSKVLRNRGIKIIHAGFTELKPVDKRITEQRIQNWRARWMQDLERKRTSVDLEFMRIRNQAWAEKKRELMASLSQMLHNPNYTEETLMLRVFQILEELSTDPTTQQFLPHDTVHLLRNLRLWMLHEEA